MRAFLEGMVAGYGIAVPVGAIAVLIVQAGLAYGLRVGLAAGGGAATADLIYAALAALAGSALSAALTPYAPILRVASALLLIGIGAHGLWLLRSTRTGAARTPEPPAGQRARRSTYLRFLGLTLLNPLTVAYFGALILGGGGGSLAGPAERAAFVLGAGLASMSWQSLLAIFGALGHRQLGAGARRMTAAVGHSVVVALGFRILLS